MRCLYCNCTESKVIDSRSADDERTIRRRRECMGCGRRFTTYETIEVAPILVVKNDGTRQAFDLGKIKRGVIKACEKRPVPIEKIDALAEDIAKRIYNSMEQEISSKKIGEMVMEGLQKLDEVAYVRYASVYRSFKDISSFMSELQKMIEKKEEDDGSK
ncbi:MAG TPA: transcriptional regulator NrdR [Firmicutes bacterium]|nr:transcriptional regulator NrdR [Bacillota bacterium]